MSLDDDSLDCPRDRGNGQAIIGTNPRYSHVRAKPMLGVIGKYATHNSEDCSLYRRNSHKLQKRGSMPESSGAVSLVKHYGLSSSSQLQAKSRSGGMLMMKRPSCDINNSSQTSIVSGQSSTAGTQGPDSQMCPNICTQNNSFEKFSKSNGYHSQVLRVSWNIIEAEILASDSFQLGKDIEKFYELHQQLSMDDLARRKVMHTKVHLVRVLSKVIRNLEKPEELDTYLRCIGRLHQLAGVDSSYLSMSGKSFCDALDSIEQHKELWSKQESTIRYVSNTMFLPLIVRSNKSLQKYFAALDQSLQGMELVECYGPKFDRTKHGSLFLSKLLIRVVPHMDQMDRVLPYLAELGALHQRHGVAKQHIDLLGLAFCAAIRGVVQGGGVKGGHLHETTKAWITLVQAVCSGMKLGYTGDKAEREAAAAEEEMSWAEEEESLRWRKSVRSGSNRLIDKRQAITYETQTSILEEDIGRRRKKKHKFNDFFCIHRLSKNKN